MEGNPLIRTDPTGHDGLFGNIVSAVTSAVSTVASTVVAVATTAAPIMLGAADAVTGISSMVNDVKTIFSGNASLLDKVLAGADLLMNVVMDVTSVVGLGEGLKAAYIGMKAGAHLVEDAAVHAGVDAAEHVGEHEAEDTAEHAAADAAEGAADQGNRTSEDLNRFGRSPKGDNPGVKEVRPGDDIQVDDGMVKAQDPAGAEGASVYTDPQASGLSGHYYKLPAGTELPDGLGVVADGADVGGSQPFGHRTIYPTRDMPFEEFDRLIRNLPWEYGGKV